MTTTYAYSTPFNMFLHFVTLLSTCLCICNSRGSHPPSNCSCKVFLNPLVYGHDYIWSSTWQSFIHVYIFCTLLHFVIYIEVEDAMTRTNACSTCSTCLCIFLFYCKGICIDKVRNAWLLKEKKKTTFIIEYRSCFLFLLK